MILSLCIEVCVETTCFDLFYYVSVTTLNHILILNWVKAEKMIFFQISPPGGRLWSSIMRKRENRSQTKTRASTWVILVSTPMFSWSQNLIMSSIFCFKHSYAQLWSCLFSETEYFIYYNAILELIVIDIFRVIVQVNLGDTQNNSLSFFMVDSCRVGPKEHFLMW